MIFLRSLPLQLGLVIALVLVFGHAMPLSWIRASYTFSLFFKELLGLILPFMVFFFVLSGLMSFKRNAPLMLAVMLSAIFCSNAIVALLSYGVMLVVAPSIERSEITCVTTVCDSIEPYSTFLLSFPSNIAVYALCAAIVIGLVLAYVQTPWANRFIFTAKRWIENILNYGFIPFLPLYVLGFLLKMRYEGSLSLLIHHYGTAFFLIVVLQISYLLWFYFLACGFSWERTIGAIKNAFPSYVAAFSTMSSAAAIPISIHSAEKNTGNKDLSLVAMPIMANVHLLGDSFGTPILALVTMLLFKGTLPLFANYFVFILYFCIAMFAVSGVPGGGMLVMIPILKSYLGFTPEMVSIIWTVYLLMDSFGTGANVMGDGALVIIVNKILKRLKLVEA